MEPPSCTLNITFNALTSGHIVSFVLLLVLLAISAMVSGSETAFFSLSPNDIDNIQKRKNKTSANVMRLLGDQDYLLATILIFNNFVNIAIILISTYLTTSLIDFSKNILLGFVFQTIIITFILLLFGEVMPKVLAASRPQVFACIMARPLVVMNKVAHPLSWILVRSMSGVNKHLNNHKSDVSIDDLSDAIEITDKSIGDKKILRGIVELTNTDVQDIMQPRIDVDAVDISFDFKKLYDFVVECGYSRIPVYAENFDNVKGILYIKDLLPYLDKGADFKWQNLVREAYFVPENKKINDLLTEFQQKSIHMAIVVDEYGGTSGLVTLEDILEEIVGEISDENDESEKPFVRLKDNVYLFEGKTLINDFCKVMNIDGEYFDEIIGDAETLAGLMLERKGEILTRGEKITFKQFEFEVESSDTKRIKKIKVTVIPQINDGKTA